MTATDNKLTIDWLNELAEIICNETGIPFKVFSMTGRDITDWKHIFTLIARQKGYHYRQIAAFLNNHRTTIYSSEEQGNSLMQTTPDFKIKYDKIYKQIGGKK